jgi:hypothetical protein
MVLYVLFESAAGFALFELKEFDETNATEESVQKQVARFETFSKIAHLKVRIRLSRLSYRSLSHTPLWRTHSTSRPASCPKSFRRSSARIFLW